jgi:ABC-2 type transport system ATP-binding protein
MTLFLTTHYLDEAQRLADRILIMSEGRIAAEGTPDEIGGRERAPGTIRFVLPAGLAAADLPALPSGATVVVDDGAVEVTTGDVLATSHAVTGWALERGLDLPGFRVSRPTLEDVYLGIIGEAVGA